MKCYCCEREVTLVRRVQLRGDVTAVPAAITGHDAPRFPRARGEYHLSVGVRLRGCYCVLDSSTGTGRIEGRVYGIAGRSRGGRAAVYDPAKYDAFVRRQANNLGIDPA